MNAPRLRRAPARARLAATARPLMPTASCRPPRQPFRAMPSVVSWPASLLACASGACMAQAKPPADVPIAAPAAITAPAAATVVITGNPLGSDRLAQPALVLTGEALAQRRAGTLGETLDGLPGVAATGFGPQASRPVIRGLDGDRIRLLDNGGASADASNLSFDHAVAVDPLVVERIEVLRGPAALLYGGNATGGVVNTLDNRIPRERIDSLGGRAELRWGGAAQERASAAVVEGGAGGLNWHADVAERRSQDLRTPRFTPPAFGPSASPVSAEAASPRDRVVNSEGLSRAGAVGVSWADAQGHLGLAVDGLHNRYGTVVEPDVTIRLQRERWALAAERRGLSGPFTSVQAQASLTRYQHQELEGDGAVGTTFRSRGQEMRLQARQAPMAWAGGTLDGSWGVQFEQLDFSALGAEAFVPGTQSRGRAMFLLQTLQLPGVTLSAGARQEQHRVHSDGDAPAAEALRFGSATARRFQPRSWMLGAVAPLPAGWSLRAMLGSTQRAPAYYELYANGVHVATALYERGDTEQALERSRHTELGLQWQNGASQLQASLFRTRFANYIALDASGQQVSVVGDDGATTLMPEYRFSGVPARLQGLELEARTRLTVTLAGQAWQLQGQTGLDLVRGDNLRTGEPLPRLAPLRLHAGLQASQGAWQLGLNLRHQARQGRVPSTDQATPAATLADLSLAYSTQLAGAAAVWQLQLANLGNAVAFNASAVPEARALSPAGARALRLGLRLAI